MGYRGGKFHRYKMGITSKVYKCLKCNLIFPNPMPIPVEPQKLYSNPDEYFYTHNEEEKISNYELLINKMQELNNKKKFKLLDIGCGRGELLAAAQTLEIDAEGIEFSKTMAQYVQKKYNINVYRTPIEEFAKDNPKAKYDAVTLNAVLEHVYDPDSMIKSISKITNPSGLLYIDVPNEPSLVTMIANLFGLIKGTREVYNLSPSWHPYHIWGFNVKSLKALLNKHGFEVIDYKIRGDFKIVYSGKFLDRLKANLVFIVAKFSNLFGMSHNLYLWARKN